MDVEMENMNHNVTLRHDAERRRTPTSRRGSMSEEEEKQRRASIKAIMADSTMSPHERRLSIQQLMDGRRTSISNCSSRCGTPPLLAGENDEASPSGAAGLDLKHMVVSPISPNAPFTFPDSAETCIPISNEQTKRAELTRPNCTHYVRKCTVVSPCCGAAFGCRICHDDCPVLPPKVNHKLPRRYPRSASLPSSFTAMDTSCEDTHHNIDRFAIKEVICRECFTKQSSKTYVVVSRSEGKSSLLSFMYESNLTNLSYYTVRLSYYRNNCVNCNVQFGDYHCNICNLWMSNDERPYHCADCGFCRVGGAENFQHCHECGMCIDRSLYSNHNCKVGKYKSNCPVCQEYLFSSRSASHEMPCGHAIHWDCFRQLAAHDSRCPVCKKTAETRERMMPTWNAMAAGVALQPVPPELARVVNITCNDCEKSDDARAWHFLGVQCRNCSSFNTVVDRIVMSGEEAHEFLETMNARGDFMNEVDLRSPRLSRRIIGRRRSHF